MSSLQSTVYFLIIYISNYLKLTLSQANCSAIDSYVQITSPDSIQRTIPSAKATFPPYTYYIPSSEVVLLSTADDSICNNQLNTDIAGKIVLMYNDDGDGDDECSEIYKTFVLQTNNAMAVLLAYNDGDGDFIEIIIDDTYDQLPGNGILTIPTRRITKMDAEIIESTINNGQTVEIQFGCYDDVSYPSVLCVYDTVGHHWYLDGDYQRQADLSKNDHPVWLYEAYTFITVNQYIFLHDGKSKKDWHWTITQDPKMNDDDKIVAQCANASVTEPSDCDIWSTTDYFSTGEDELSINRGFKVNSTLCTLSDNYLCIESSQSSLAGLAGTYRQWNKNVAVWFREFSVCDEQSGYLIYDDRQFKLVDPMDGWIIASCFVGSQWTESNLDIIKMWPSIYCDSWYSINDGSLDPEYKSIDYTLSISQQGKCIDDESLCPDDDIKVDEVCLERNNVMHSFLEGDYSKTGVIGRKYGTYEYKRNDELVWNGKKYAMYIWFYGEISDQLKFWVISPTNYTTAAAANGSSVYGYCSADVNSPTNCKSCWNFYWSTSNTSRGAWHSDCQFYMRTGNCPIQPTRPPNISWPEYLCITMNDTIFEGSISTDRIRGGYVKDDFFTNESGGNVPHWKKPPNDYESDVMYLYYDAFYGYWQIGDGIHKSADLVCMEDTDDYSPEQCNSWYDITNDTSILLNSLNLYHDGCSSYDVLTKSITHTEAIKQGEIAVIVLLILLIIGCSIAGYYYYRKNSTGRAGFGSSGTGRRRKSGERISQHDSGSIEFGEHDDALPLATTTDGGNTKTGGFDMTTITSHDDDKNKGRRSDDDDDGMSDDGQQHGIVDDNDGEEFLGNHIDVTPQGTGNETYNDNDGDNENVSFMDETR